MEIHRRIILGGHVTILLTITMEDLELCDIATMLDKLMGKIYKTAMIQYGNWVCVVYQGDHIPTSDEILDFYKNQSFLLGETI